VSSRAKRSACFSQGLDLEVRRELAAEAGRRKLKCYLPEMRGVAPFIVGLARAVGGCSSTQKQVIGDWKLDPGSLSDLLKTAPNHHVQQEAMSGLSQMSLRFSEHSKVTMSVMGISQTDLYALSGRVVTVSGLTSFGGQRTKLTLTLNNDVKSLSSSGGASSLKFSRAS
jgi:hypothetical protein